MEQQFCLIEYAEGSSIDWSSSEETITIAQRPGSAAPQTIKTVRFRDDPM